MRLVCEELVHRENGDLAVLSKVQEATIARERTCVGCRQRDEQTRLLRFVADGRGHLTLDPLRRARGRGVYVCPTVGCLVLAIRGGAARGLRRRIAPIRPQDLASRAARELGKCVEELVDRALADGRARPLGGERIDPGRVIEGLGAVDVPVVVTDRRLGCLLAALEEQMCRLRAELAPPSTGSAQK